MQWRMNYASSWIQRMQILLLSRLMRSQVLAEKKHSMLHWLRPLVPHNFMWRFKKYRAMSWKELKHQTMNFRYIHNNSDLDTHCEMDIGKQNTTIKIVPMKLLRRRLHATRHVMKCTMRNVTLADCVAWEMMLQAKRMRTTTIPFNYILS